MSGYFQVSGEVQVFVSTIIPTVARSSLDRAVQSVLGQQAELEFEVIVVNDSGRLLPEAPWRQDPRVTVIDTNRCERCVARNAGAAIAHGRYLHFLDDDDWLLPNAFASLAGLADQTGGTWLFGGSQLVDRQDKPLIELHHALAGNCSAPVMSGEWIPLQSSLIDARLFFAVGGFNPAIPGAEDIDLIRRLSLATDIAGTPSLVACIKMGEQGSTTDYSGSRRQLRVVREQMMDEPGTRTRLRGSATSPYWHGRITRIYLTSALWNMGQGRFWTALERMCQGVTSLAAAGNGMFSGQFWEALLRAYKNETFARGFEAADLLQNI